MIILKNIIFLKINFDFIVHFGFIKKTVVYKIFKYFNSIFLLFSINSYLLNKTHYLPHKLFIIKKIHFPTVILLFYLKKNI